LDVPTHWTYTTCKPEDGLYQGDIIAREPLLGVLNDVHKHFCDPKYLSFIVLTQTCDLVLRNRSACKAKHISLAVIRPLSALMPGLLEEMCNSPGPGVFSKDRREEAEQFLHRVLNQNEQTHGWVYLQPDGDIGIGEPAVAMLRISISLRAKEHYELIRKSRCGRLDTEYRNKLGWLKGNLYSRIDTTDWAEKDSGEAEEKAIIKDLLDAPIGGRPPIWVPSGWIAEVKKKRIKLDDLQPDQINQVLRDNAPKPPLELALAEVKRIVDLMRVEFTDSPAKAFSARVENDPCILPLLARAIAQTVSGVIGEQQWQYYESLASDAALLGYVAAGLRQQATKFATRHGPRSVGLFIDALAVAPILTADAVGRVGMLSENAFGADWLANQEQINPMLRAMTTPPALVEHFRAAAISSVQESLADRMAGKLTNSQTFKKTLKPE
jgi:hypothetical protein